MFLRNTFVLFAIFLTSCISIQSQKLSNNGVTNQKKSKIIFDKSNLQLNHWYSCDDSKIKIQENNDNVKIAYQNAMGSCFGVWFDSIDVTKLSTVNVKLKYEGIDSSEVLIGFTDIYKNKTYEPSKVRVLKSQTGFVEYFIDYKDEIMKNPSKFDFTKVNSLLFFINITGRKNDSGNLIIENISLKDL